LSTIICCVWKNSSTALVVPYNNSDFTYCDSLWAPSQARTTAVWIVILIASCPFLVLMLVNWTMHGTCINTIETCSSHELNGTTYIVTTKATYTFNLMPKTTDPLTSAVSAVIATLPFMKYVWVDLGHTYTKKMIFFIDGVLLTSYWVYQTLIYVLIPGSELALIGMLFPVASFMIKFVMALQQCSSWMNKQKIRRN